MEAACLLGWAVVIILCETLSDAHPQPGSRHPVFEFEDDGRSLPA